MPVIWNYSLILLSLLTAITGSLTALTHAQRMRTSSGRAAQVWMVFGGITLGLAIWSMHFVGMLAFHLEIPIGYDLTLTYLSVFPGVAAALLAFYVLRQPVLTKQHIAVSSVLMGAGISLMHYTGMAALRMSPPIEYTPFSVVASILVAVIASLGAVLMMYRGNSLKIASLPRFMLSGVIMGVAIAGMHYTSLLGMRIPAGSVCLSATSGIGQETPAVFVLLASLVLFGGGIFAAMFDQRLAREKEAALALLEEAHAELQVRSKDLAEQEALLRSITDAAQEAVVLIDSAGLVTYWNPAAENIFGYTGAEIIGQNLHDLVTPERDLAAHKQGFAQFIQRGTGLLIGKMAQLQAKHKNGQEFPVEVSLSAVKRNGQWSAVGIVRDITERKAAQEEIERLAFYDPLTNLPNRRLLLDRCSQALRASGRSQKHGALMYLDLDRFKTLNDTRGHDFGDMLLREVAHRLRAGMVRAEDTVARMGGDEFVILLEDLSPEAPIARHQAAEVAEKIRAAIDTPYELDGHFHSSSPSIGICLFKGAGASVNELLMHADKAMYQAKGAGRNTVWISEIEA